MKLAHKQVALYSNYVMNMLMIKYHKLTLPHEQLSFIRLKRLIKCCIHHITVACITLQNWRCILYMNQACTVIVVVFYMASTLKIPAWNYICFDDDVVSNVFTFYRFFILHVYNDICPL